jgi:hypothetical protein
MPNKLETFVRDNRNALDNASPDPILWEEISAHTNKPSRFSLLKWLKKVRAWWVG